MCGHSAIVSILGTVSPRGGWKVKMEHRNLITESDLP